MRRCSLRYHGKQVHDILQTVSGKGMVLKMGKVNYALLYQLLDNLTPLREDCGSVCGSACCSKCNGDDDESGMLLFPGEPVSEDTTVRMIEKDGMRLEICEGKCERGHRPLACRIFPLFPFVGSDGRVRVVYDPRAYGVCPLLQYNGIARIQPEFVRAVRRIGRLLLEDEACKAFLMDQSQEIAMLYRLSPLREARLPICRR